MVKQILLYRRDLKMRKGKIGAQVAHASMAVFLRRRVKTDRIAVQLPSDPQDQWREAESASTLVVPMTEDMVYWVTKGVKKIVLSVDDEEALLTAHRLAEEAGLPCALIRDAGHTEFGGVPTYTAVAIGPAKDQAIDAITGPEGKVKTKLA